MVRHTPLPLLMGVAAVSFALLACGTDSDFGEASQAQHVDPSPHLLALCIDDETIIIDRSEVDDLLAEGASVGPCSGETVCDEETYVHKHVKPGKVAICHVPKGNPSNAHTIVVGEPATKAHVGRHGGDYLGPCSGMCDEEDAEHDPQDPVDPPQDPVDPPAECTTDQTPCDDDFDCSESETCIGGCCDTLVLK